jgi:UTP--glucose-1-phosphate uridylyltransferase
VVPKELLPIVDRPALALVIEELRDAGVDELLLVGSARKPALEAWFRRDPALDAAFAGRSAKERECIDPPAVTLHVVHQARMGGTGDALRLVRDFAGADPVLVAFPDDLFGALPPFPGPNPSAVLRDVHARTGASVLAAVDLGEADVSRYGVLDARPDGDHLVVRGIVEKPSPGTEPSRLVSVGRFLYTPSFFDALEATWAERPADATGEFWPMPAMLREAAAGRLRAALVEAPRWDTGTTEGYLKAVIDHALADEELAATFRPWLAHRLDRP